MHGQDRPENQAEESERTSGYAKASGNPKSGQHSLYLKFMAGNDNR
jgi:hypothetical protein